MPIVKRPLLLLISIIAQVLPLAGASYYPLRLDDPKAVYVLRDNSSVQGDLDDDDSDAIQQAINQVQETTRQGIVFLPEGRYRITKTIYIWPGIRVIGYGATRPVLLLAANTPGYQDEQHERLMIFFAGGRPGSRHGPPDLERPRDPDNDQPPDANPGTFYSALSNVDLEIGEGNPGAVGIRSRYAQHCFLAHMNFQIGSGLAGIHEAGNVVEDVHFFGGKYAIWTGTPSPGWQFTAVDATFEGQKEAAIREHAAGLTLIRPQFKNLPTAIEIEPRSPDDLWMKDALLENISGPAVIISQENSARTEINMENAVCKQVSVFALFRESGRKVAGPGTMYAMKVFSHGLNFASLTAIPEIKDVAETAILNALPAPAKSDLPDLPSRETWVNIRSLGAKGDGASDDTEVLRNAIAHYRTIYFPTGRYVVSDSIILRPDTVLIGLHPSTTQIDLLDSTPAFQGPGSPKPLIEAPPGGTNIMIGIGLYTNGINSRAVAAKWMAGKTSMINDVRFLGGHGTNRPDGSRENPYNNTHTADPDLNRRWDSQYPSLWVTQGGGGTFFDIWTPSTFAQAGMLVSDTSTEGRIYQMSSEHHVRNEVELHNVANWQIYALQTEEERGESGSALPVEIDGSSNITIANFHIYRVISSYQPFPWAIKVSNSTNIRLRNVHCYSNSKVSFDNAVYDETHNIEIRQREFAWLNLLRNDLLRKPPQPAPRQPSIVLAPDEKVEKLCGGFFNISGGATAPSGDFYFVDAHMQRIYRWDVNKQRVSLIQNSPLDPVNLAFDNAGNLMVVSYAGNGTVYSFKPRPSEQRPSVDGTPEDEVMFLKATLVAARPNLAVILPTGDWHIDPSRFQQPYRQYLSPDGAAFLAVDEAFVTGAVAWGIKSSSFLRAFGLAPAYPGKPFYITDESELSTWVGTVQPDGSLADMKIFVNQGGESVTADSHGNVYVAAGQVFVYSPAGRLIDMIDVPERPLQVMFGGKDGRTLFIPARTALYAIRTRFAGQMKPSTGSAEPLH